MSENEPSAAKTSSEDDDDNKNITLPKFADMSYEMENLEERFSQQQVMISQLKEMMLAEETARTEKITSTRLKMEKYVSRLAKIRDRTKHKQNLPSSTSKVSDTVEKSTLEESTSTDLSTPPTPDNRALESESVSQSNILSSKPSDIASEKPKLPNREVTKLLHQQIKERKAMIAERTKNEKELEKALMKIQKQLDESQSQSAEILQAGQSKLASDIPLILNENVDKTIIELRSKINHLEGNILDLQETCKEKDNVIRSKTEAITLMSADLSKKGKVTLDLLDDTKEQMQKMQENFANMESNMKSEKNALLSELEVYKNKITYLEEANSILETERFKLSIENTGLEDKIAEKEIEITNINCMLQEKIKELTEFSSQLEDVPKIDEIEEKGVIEVAEMNQLSEKIEILEKLNNTLRQSNIELQEKLDSNTDRKSNTPPVEQQVKSSPKSKPKFNKNTYKGAHKSKSFEEEKKSYLDSIKKLESTIETLSKHILEKEILLHQKEVEVEQLKETLKPVESLVESSQDLVVAESSLSIQIEDQPIEGSSDVVVGDVEDPDNVSLKDQLEDALKQIENLTKDLSEANKNMIKLKATHKTKVKQMQKSIDDYSKVSHSNAEVVRLQSDVNTLTQKVAELEDDKGNLQLHLVDYDSGRVSDSQLHAKLVDVESVAEERLKAIADLEMQKFDLVQELHLVKQRVTELEDKMADLTFLENEHVSSEIKYAQLEEHLDALKSDKTNLLQQVKNITAERNSLLLDVEAFNKEKSEMSNKLDYYIQENMELIDRLEKLSTEKVSSAESIEMVESLTSQEKLEIEHFQKSYSVQKHEKQAEETKEEDTFAKSDTDKVNLLNKIDLYSQERDKVIDKLESLQVAHNEISLRLEELTNEKKLLEEQYDFVKKEKDDVCIELKTNEEKIVQLGNKIEELSYENSSLSEKLSQLSTPVRTEEVIVSETIEVEDTIEKEFIEYPINAEVSEAMIESKPIELVKETSKPVKPNNKGYTKLTKEILRLKNTLKYKETEISDLNVQLSDLFGTVKNNEDLLINNELLSNKIQDLLHENLSLINQIAQLNSEKELVEDLQQINFELSETKDILSENMSVIEIKDLEILNLKQNIIEKEVTFNTCNSKLISELENKISCLQTVIDQNNYDISDLRSELYESFDNSDKFNYLMERLQTSITCLVGCLDNKQLEIVATTNEKIDIVDKMLKLELECSEKDEMIASINQQLLQSSNNFVDHSQSLSAYESEMSKLNERCKAYEVEESRLNQCYDLLEKTYASQSAKFQDANDSLQAKSDMCDKLKMVVEKLKNKLKSEIQRCKDLDGDMNTLKSQHSILEINYNRIQSELEQSHNLEHTVNQLQVQIADLHSQNENAMLSIRYTENRNDDLVTQMTDMLAKISQSELQIEQTRQENESYLRCFEEMKVEIKNNESALWKIAELEEQLFAKQEEVKTLIRQLEELGNTYNETTSAHEAKIQEREVYIESLEIDLNKYKDKINRLEENLLVMESLEKKTNSLVTKLQEKDLAFSETLQHEDELTKKLTNLAAQDKQIQKQLNEIKHENNELHETIASLNDSKKHLQSKLDISRSETSHLKNIMVELEAANQDRNVLIERYNTLQDDLRDVTQEYSEKLHTKTQEFEYLETTLQTQCENYDEQIKQTKEHCKRLQEEIATHLKTIGEVTADNERLRNDVENLNSNNSNNVFLTPLFKFEDSNFQQNQTVIDQDVFNLQIEIGNLTSALNEKDEFILRLKNEILGLMSAPQSVLNEEVFMKATQALSNEAPKFFDQLNVNEVPIIDLRSLEDQIVSNDCAKMQNISNVETSLIRGFCHDPPVAVVQTSTTQTANTSIVDEIIEPKVAFKCFASEDDSHSLKISELESSMETLKAEKEKLSSELAQSLLKTNKALLKLKEYKIRCDNLTIELKKSKSNGATSDLDTAIQEELYSQIAKLEERLKDVSSNSNKEKMERECLQKRVDVLTCSNERLIEMKEKQDLEIGVFKLKNKSLDEKLKNLQWVVDFDMEDEKNPEDDVKSKAYLKIIDELNVKVRDLESDNENLQLTLSEQKNKFELMIQKEEQMSERNGDSLDEFKKENEELKKSLDEALNAKNNLNSYHEFTENEKNNLKHELIRSSDVIIQNYAQIELFKNENLELKDKFEILVHEFTEFQEKFQVLLNDKDKLELEYTDMTAFIRKLEEENKNITIDLTNTRNELSKISYEKEELVEKYDTLVTNIDEMRCENKALEIDLHENVTVSTKCVLELSCTRQNLELVSQELTDCRYYNCQLEEELKNLQASLNLMADSKNKYEDEGLHVKCLQSYSDLKSDLESFKNEQEDYALGIKSQLATEIQKYHVLDRECESLMSALSEKELENITINKELDLMKRQLFDAQTTLAETHKTIELKDKDLQIFYHNEETYNSKIDDFNTYCNARDGESIRQSEEIQSLNNAVHEKEVELANLRLNFHSERTRLESSALGLTDKATFLDKQLETKVEECRSLKAKLEESQTLIDEEATQMGEMRSALEAQELEIVTLKENLQAHVEAYDKLSKSYNKSGRHVTFSDDTKFSDDSIAKIVNKDDPVSPRADLDLALYMLHQRDVRCEELTVELMSLLEERDTLQLKLSNAIRTNEELRIRVQPSAEIQVEESLTMSVAPQTSATPDSPAENSEEPNSNVRTLPETSEPDGKDSTGSSLENKISELHSVSHFRDIRVKDERESRQRQMELLQRDVQNLPPEAAAHLREAHYTLSRDTQSASTVLFNWLWGRTTPKVVHM